MSRTVCSNCKVSVYRVEQENYAVDECPYCGEEL